jgi:hypothetical protein
MPAEEIRAAAYLVVDSLAAAQAEIGRIMELRIGNL